MDRLSEVFGERVQFRYTCLDRIVLHGYLTGLQRPGQLVHFFHDVVGIDCIEPKVLLGRTTAYRDWVDRYTAGPGDPGAGGAEGGAEGGAGPAVLREAGSPGGDRLRADEPGEQPDVHLVHAPADATERRRDLPPDRDRAEAVPAPVLVRLGPGHGADEPAGLDLPAVHDHRLPERPPLREPAAAPGRGGAVSAGQRDPARGRPGGVAGRG